MLVNLNLRCGWRYICIIGFENNAWCRLFATFDADDILATHGAEARHFFRKSGVGKGAGETNRGILCDVERDTGRVSYRGGDLVAHDA